MALIGTPPIGVKTGDSTGFQQTLQLKENRILSSPKDIRQDRTTVVMLGRRKARYLVARLLTPPLEHRTCDFDRIRRST